MNGEEVFSLLKENVFDVVIHTATYDAAAKFSTKDPTKVLENNLRMFFNVVRGNKYYGRLIYFGYGAEFDRAHWKPKMSEEYFDEYIPSDQYGLSKYIMTKYALKSDNIYNLRLFGVYGKYDDWRTRVIPNLCSLAVLNKPLRINQNKFYDFISIDEWTKVVECFIVNKPKHKVYNVCSGRTIDFLTIAKMINKIADNKLKIIVENEGLGKEYSGVNNLLLGEFNNLKFIPIDCSLKALYCWYESNKEKLVL